MSHRKTHRQRPSKALERSGQIPPSPDGQPEDEPSPDDLDSALNQLRGGKPWNPRDPESQKPSKSDER